MKMCKMCNKPYISNTNTVCCSDECRLENKRQSRRRSWHRIGRYTDDKYGRYIKQKLRRIDERRRRKADS